MNRIEWMQAQYRLDESDKILHKTPYSFDVSVWGVYLALYGWPSACCCQTEGHKDPDYMTQMISEHGITCMHFVPSVLQILLEYGGDSSQYSSLKHVICSGEALPQSACEMFFKKIPNAELHNLYGPTEASIDVTSYECTSNPY